MKIKFLCLFFSPILLVATVLTVKGQTQPQNPITGAGVTNRVPYFTNTYTIGSSNIFVNGTSIGIGVAPLSRYSLDILSNNGLPISLYRDVSLPGYGSVLSYDLNNSSGSRVTYGKVVTGIENPTAGSHSGFLSFQLATKGVFDENYNQEKMRILSNGNVGIGTNAPTNNLQINSANPAETNLSLLNTSVGGASGAYITLQRYGRTGAGEYWQGLQSTNTASLATNSLFVLRATEGLVFSGSYWNEHMRIAPNGSVGIGTTLASNPNNYKLAVNGTIGAKAVRVETTSGSWSDYVFYDSYRLRPLSEVEAFIRQHQHLPDVPSAQEVEQNGINLGETDALLLKKIEELTLYVIEQNKEINALKKANEQIRQQLHKQRAND